MKLCPNVQYFRNKKFNSPVKGRTEKAIKEIRAD